MKENKAKGIFVAGVSEVCNMTRFTLAVHNISDNDAVVQQDNEVGNQLIKFLLIATEISPD